MSILLTLFICAYSINEPVRIDQAVEQKLINLTLETNMSGSHYESPIEATFTNISGKTLTIHIPVGYTFQPDNKGYQKQMNQQTEFVVLHAGQVKKHYIKSFCIQASNRWGHAFFTLAGFASAKLKAIAEFIESQKLLGLSAQHAVWSVSDGRDLEDICSYDTAADRKLQKKVAELMGKPMPLPPKPDDYRHNYYAPASSMKVKIGSSYSLKLSKPHDVTLGMYNTQNIIVRELYSKKAVPSGDLTVNFEFDGAEYTDPRYRFKLMVDGKAVLDDEMEFTEVPE